MLNEPNADLPPDEKHGHYYRSFHGHKIDFYRLVDLFGPLGAAQQHALKKILFAGDRPHKDQLKDINEAIDTLKRWLEIIEEDQDEENPTSTEDANVEAEQTETASRLASVLERARLAAAKPIISGEVAQVQEGAEDEKTGGV